MRGIVAASLLCAACVSAGPPVDVAVYPDAAGMPRDVQAFIVRWQDCHHWLGEPGDHPDRRREIDRAVRRLCPGIDARARRLRARHAADATIIARLAAYEALGQ
jgi:hypothetical protein